MLDERDLVEDDLKTTFNALRAAASELAQLGRADSAAQILRAERRIVAELRPTRFVDETTAAILTGRSARWLAGRHAAWGRAGGARFHAGARQYRFCVLPIEPSLAPA